MLYKCGENGCRGHTTFNETCSSKPVVANDYPVLREFIEQQDGDDNQDTQPTSPVNKDPKGPGMVGVALHKDGKGKTTKDLKEKLAKIQNKQ